MIPVDALYRLAKNIVGSKNIEGVVSLMYELGLDEQDLATLMRVKCGEGCIPGGES